MRESTSVVILQGWNCSGQAGMLWQRKQVGQLHSGSSMVGLKLFFYVLGMVYGTYC